MKKRLTKKQLADLAAKERRARIKREVADAAKTMVAISNLVFAAVASGQSVGFNEHCEIENVTEYSPNAYQTFRASPRIITIRIA